MEISTPPTARHYDRAVSTSFIVVLAFCVLRRLFWLHEQQPGYAGFAVDIAGVIVASGGLFVLTFLRRDDRCRGVRSATAGALVGFIVFVAVLGVGLVDPTRIDWLLRGDWAQHFLGWHFYRNAAWSVPPGAFDTWLYPVGTSIVYTDSLPLLAMPLKLIAPWLPAHFQYIGFWFLINCVMQGLFGALLIACFTRNLGLQTIGAGLFLLAPIFLARLPHDTLTTQWLILASFWMYFRDTRSNSTVGWLAICALTALVHPYLSAMVIALMCAFYVSAWRHRAMPARTALIGAACAIGITLLLWWLSGVFILKIRGGFEPAIYNANLLTWFDSESWSRWIPALPHVGVGQYEGFGYLGMGVFVLLIAAMISRRPIAGQTSFRFPMTPLVMAVFALTLFAFSTRLTLGDITLLDVTPKRMPLLGAFRCSGRFIWPSVYLIMIVAAARVSQRGGRWAAPVFAIAFFIQFFELSPLHMSGARMRIGQFSTESEVMLHDPYWSAAAAGRKHLQLVPACGAETVPYFPLSMLAADHGLTINTAYLARMDGIRWERYCADAQSTLDTGRRDRDTLYVVHSTALSQFQASSNAPLDCRRVEGYDACVVGASPPAAAADFEPLFDCYRVNYAWGFSLSGTAVGRDGRIVRYASRERDRRGEPQTQNGMMFYDATKLRATFEGATPIGTVDAAALESNSKLIDQLKSATVRRNETGARDAGSSTCHAYIPEPSGTRYRDIPLGSDASVADFRLVNDSPAAAELMTWLQSIGVANK